MSNYFDHPFCSNSSLTQIKRELTGADYQEYPNAYRMGTLIDAVITEHSKVDLYRRVVEEYNYTAQEIDLAKKMRSAFMSDPLAAQLMKVSDTQVEMYITNVPFNFNGVDFQLDCKCKYDGFASLTKWGWDLKSTVATSHAAFVAAIERFDYDRQAYWYMKLARAKRMALIGVSKINFKVFKVLISEGDDMWQSGKEKCDQLAFKYWVLKDKSERHNVVA